MAAGELSAAGGLNLSFSGRQDQRVVFGLISQKPVVVFIVVNRHTLWLRSKVKLWVCFWDESLSLSFGHVQCFTLAERHDK